MCHVELEYAQNRLSELIDRAARGEEIVITRSNQPLAKLIAVEQKRRRHPGSAKGLVRLSADFDEPLDDLREYM